MKTIIVPTDFSEVAHNATDYAINLAKYLNVRLVLVNACQLRSVAYDVPFSEETIAQLYASSKDSLDNLKTDLQKKHGDTVLIECVAGVGSAFEVISKTARTLKADLIVMGIGEAGKIKELLIGSTALTVAREQPVPTLIIPANLKYNPIKKISFACDLDQPEQTDLLKTIKHFCKMFNAEIEIVNVADPNELMTMDKTVKHLYVESNFNAIKHKSVSLDGTDVAKELEEYFKSHDTDVIVLSPQKHNLLYYLFNNSITRSLTYHLKSPILAIH